MPKVSIEKLIDAHLIGIHRSLDAIREDSKAISKKFSRFEKTLLRNTITVEEHQRRSTLLEKNQEGQLESLQKIASTLENISERVDEVERDIEPVKKHVETVGRVMSLFVALDNNKRLIIKIIIFILSVWGAIWIYLSDNEFVKMLL